MGSLDLPLSVVLATRNRARCLAETLEAFSRLDGARVNVQWVIVDNNSSDDTRRVVESYRTSLGLTHLFAERPGKNVALNQAIARLQLREVVIFTDDDVTPRRDWLSQIRRASLQYPSYSVFGGRITPSIPPAAWRPWMKNKALRELLFAEHHMAPCVTEYPRGRTPYGPNFWIRRSVLESGYRFPEHVGPRPRHRIMGGETVFLLNLQAAGFGALYIPEAVVEHRLPRSHCSFRNLVRRSVWWGRQRVYTSGIPRRELRDHAVWQWYAFLLARFLFYLTHLAIVPFSGDPLVRMQRTVRAVSELSYTLESIACDPGADQPWERWLRVS